MNVNLFVTKKLGSNANEDKNLRCGGTWFPGVNFLENDSHGNVTGVSFPKEISNLIKKNEPAFNRVFDKAQVSICYPGYPLPTKDESKAAFEFRRDRFAAHIDGILPIGQSKRRFLKEYHSMILGIPINNVKVENAPCVVWEGSHIIVRNEFKDYMKGKGIDSLEEEDISDFYKDLRRKIFKLCRVKKLHAPMGQAYLINRLCLHGIFPWQGICADEKTGRRIAYFRPELVGGQQYWLR